MIVEVMRKIVPGVLLCLVPLGVFAAPLQQAISEFEQENYEEALQILETLRASQEDAELSFYLGLTYHRMGENRKGLS